jgi:hypothetical protein
MQSPFAGGFLLLFLSIHKFGQRPFWSIPHQPQAVTIGARDSGGFS